jgi:CubicO group peptidase (beta-lactamase class C family)
VAESAFSEYSLAGLSIAVMVGNDIEFANGYGFEDIDQGVEATPKTIYMIGSVSKQFAAVGILQLVEEGAVGLDDPITTYLPDFEDSAPPILIRHLLRHTSGISDDLSPDLRDLQTSIEPAEYPLRAAVPLIARQRRLYAPGDWWSYSNVNYALLAALIERVTGMSYEDFLAVSFFRPHGLSSTRVCGQRWAEDRPRAVRYNVDNGVLSEADALWVPDKANGICTSVLDLAQWMRALVDGGLVSEESYERIISVEPVAAGFTPPYGFGLSMTPLAGEPAVWHTGVGSGVFSLLAYFPNHDVIIAMAANTGGRPLELAATGATLARATMGLANVPLRDLDAGGSEIERILGTYNDYLFEIRVSNESGQPQVQIPRMGVTEPLLYQGGNEFSTPKPTGLRFRFEPAGERAQLVIFDWMEIRSYGRRSD